MQPPPVRDVARRLAALLQDAPGAAPQVRPFAARLPPRRAVAIDGSNVTLWESGSHLVGAWRAAAATVEAGKALAPRRTGVEVALLSDRDARLALAERLAKEDPHAPEIAPLPPSAALEALRALEEWRLALDAVEAMGEGDLLLLDGAVQVRPPLLLAQRLLERAKERRVDVVGVCKSTSITLGGAPAIAACHLAARGRSAPWLAEVPAPPAVRARVFVARLSGAEERPFRFDVAAWDDDAQRALGLLVGLAAHPGHPGYPSPLAMAHQAAMIAEDERRSLAASVAEAVEAEGVPGGAWRAAFLDYHDVLDLGA